MCGLVTAYNGVELRQHCLMWFLPDNTKPLPRPLVTYNHWKSAAFTWWQFPNKCPGYGHDANFIITDGTIGCKVHNLGCHQCRQNCPDDYSQFPDWLFKKCTFTIITTYIPGANKLELQHHCNACLVCWPVPPIKLLNWSAVTIHFCPYFPWNMSSLLPAKNPTTLLAWGGCSSLLITADHCSHRQGQFHAYTFLWIHTFHLP